MRLGWGGEAYLWKRALRRWNRDSCHLKPSLRARRLFESDQAVESLWNQDRAQEADWMAEWLGQETVVMYLRGKVAVDLDQLCKRDEAI